MTVYWICRQCGASGEGDKAAEQHVRETTHTTETRARPWRTTLAIPFTLTDAGWAATSSGWTT